MSLLSPLMLGIHLAKSTNSFVCRESGCRRILLILLVALGSGLCLTVGAYVWRYRYGFISPSLPAFPLVSRQASWPTPPVAERFDFPLLPAESYGPYAQGITGPLEVDTRYDVQNPAFGNRSNCFRGVGGGSVPFSQLYHAGVDLFALNNAGQVVWGKATHVPVHAVADGVAVLVQDAGADGYIVIVEHTLADSSAVYSVYWHTSHVQVRAGQPVDRGQVIAVVYDQGFNSHLHWEVRTFYDGSNLFPENTAGARGTCNGHIVGVGYTWDAIPARAHPGHYGYLDPTSFVKKH